jgi:membrane-bound inhibitor of C-type lysozyme
MTMMNKYTGSLYELRAATFYSVKSSAIHMPVFLLAAAVLLFAITGCVTSAEQKNKWVYTCPDGYEFTAVFSQDSESVTLEDETQKLKLKIEPSASGARYTDGTAVFWNKGVMARVELAEGVLHEECQGNSN